jgi:hypothetical protein
MAERKSNRSARRGRAGGHETRTHPASGRRTSRLARRSKPQLSSGPSLELNETLTMVVKRLQVMHAVAVTVERALRHQNCEQDVEIADCLRFGVSNPVFEQATLIEHFVVQRKPG